MLSSTIHPSLVPRSFNLDNIDGGSGVAEAEALQGMKVKTREEEEKGRTVVVGVKMDSLSRELLTWALVKAAQPGDLVVALHVLHLGSTSSADVKSDSVGNNLNSVLAVYEGFCNLKQIDLKLSICRGSSIRKALVQETQKLSAAKLVLGASKSSHLIGISSTSVAKYCAKKLPNTCAVLAVSNGKVVFQREEASGRRKVQNSSSKSLLLLEASNDNSFCVLPPRKYGQQSNVSVEKKLLFSTTNGASKKSCASESGAELQKEGSLDLVPVCKKESIPGTIRLLIESLPDGRPGWPLLQKAVLQSKKSSTEETEMDVAQWAMCLPSRSSSSAATVDSEHEPPMLKIECLEDKIEGAITPLGVDCVRLLDATSEESPKHLKELKSLLHEKYVSTCNLFNFQELADATSNFSDENLIGKGGNSRVYKGILPKGQELAVKILKRSEEVLQEFVGEIEIITTLHHRNIINLSGFCFNGNDLLLVYDFLPRGSLEDNLHGLKKNKNTFAWAERYNVAIGVAEALNYLHNREGDQTVIHRDVKCSNILLTDNFEPKLADFGLATWASSASTQTICSDVVGTFGYLAPEYFMFGKVSEKIDVYAFGVVLLELLSGRKPIDNEHPQGTHSLVVWANQILQNGNCKELLDPDLESNDYDDAQAERLILAASLSITRDPRLRPTISTVLKLLHGDDMEVVEWAKIQVNDSELEDGTITCARTNFPSHLSLALLDVEDDALSVCSLDRTVDYIMSHSSLEAYLKGRWSRSSSFE